MTNAPDHIYEMALIEASRWQREAIAKAAAKSRGLNDDK